MPKTALEQWDETAANNTDVGGVDIDEGCAPSGMNNAHREEMAQFAKWLGDDTLASASTTDLGSVPGRYVSITGTTTITAFGTIKAGTVKYVKFAGALTLTHNATSLILPGAANITTAAGDTAVFVSEGSGNWRCLAYQAVAPVPNTLNGQYKFPATQNASSNANTLDDYEEADSWTPVLTFATPGNLTVAYSTQVGAYTKIGRVVTATFSIITSTFTHTTASGACQITGLPFAAKNVSSVLYIGTLSFGGITKAGFTDFSTQVVASTTMTLNASGSGQNLSAVNATDMPTGGGVALRGTITYFTD